MKIQITDEKGLAAIVSDNEYEIGNDIKVSASWVSLRNIANVSIYGNGYKISGLKQPLFGSVSLIKIYNLSIECDILEHTGRYVGAFIRYGLQATLQECRANGFITGADYVGGIAGDLSQSTIDHCVNNVEITASSYFGGIMGCVSHSSITNNTNNGGIHPVQQSVFGGGIAGRMLDECFVSDNVNIGTITEFKTNCCGGITGGVSGSRVFQGNINRGIINGGSHVGGIAGMADTTAIQYNECYMPVSGSDDNTGGIVGYVEAAPMLITGCVVAGAIDCVRRNAGGIAGRASAGTIITDNTISCPSIHAADNPGRILGFGEDGVFMRNTRVFAGCTLTGLNGKLMYRNQIVFPDDPGVKSSGNMGETFIPPAGFRVSGLRLTLVPISSDAPDIGDEIQNQNVKAMYALSETFTQITASLSMGASALANAFQTTEAILYPLLRREADTIRVLRSVRDTIDAYCDFIESSEITAHSMDENEETSLSIRNRIERIVISCDSERTNQPLAGATVFIYGEGYNNVMTSDFDGTVLLDNIHEGVYEITEHTAPRCYERKPETHKVTISFGGALIDGKQVNCTNGEVILKISHQRDESQLYITGENWAARPEAWQVGLLPQSNAYTPEEPTSEVLQAREIAQGVLSELLNVTEEAAR
jgi:hypothetical protein